MDILLDCLKVGAFVAWLGFLIVYTTFADWWRSPIGRNVFGTGLLLASVFGLVVLASLFPGFLGRPIVQCTVYVAGIYLGLQRAIQVIRVQREDGRWDQSPEQSEERKE